MVDNDAVGGTSPELTATSAAPFFKSLLSAEEDPQPTEEPPVQQSTEPASETDEVEASSEQAQPEQDKSEETETTEATEEQPTDILYPVRINGVEEMVTLDELRKGYSRTKDYTQKTQEVAEKRKQLEAEFPAVREERVKLAEMLSQLDQAIAESTPEEPDWAKLQTEQPDQFPLVWASWQAAEKRRDAVRVQRDAAIAAVQRDQTQARQSYREDQKAKLLDAIPEWKNAETAKSETQKLRAFAREIGYSAEELDTVDDHRPILLLREAFKWREAQKKKPAVQQKIEKVKAATPGPSAESNAAPVSEITRAKQRLAKTGTREDAAAVFEKMGF